MSNGIDHRLAGGLLTLSSMQLLLVHSPENGKSSIISFGLCQLDTTIQQSTFAYFKLMIGINKLIESVTRNKEIKSTASKQASISPPRITPLRTYKHDYPLSLKASLKLLFTCYSHKYKNLWGLADELFSEERYEGITKDLERHWRSLTKVKSSS